MMILNQGPFAEQKTAPERELIGSGMRWQGGRPDRLICLPGVPVVPVVPAESALINPGVGRYSILRCAAGFQ